jgi:DNA helicase-2/ATP-dependent DNA helicase PcrA
MTLALEPAATADPLDRLLGALDPEQRAAAVLPDGPAQIIAPAGSGKTTTLVARLGVLLDRGVPADRICVVTFNRDAAAELSTRISARLTAVQGEASRIEVRTLHALARQVVFDGSGSKELVADRLPLLRAARRSVLVGRDPAAPPIPEVDDLDGQLSAWKVERRAPTTEARPVLDVYAARLVARAALDFDDLVAGAIELLERDARVRHRWQARFSHVCVDEFQDVDAAQLRLVRLLAAPENNLYVVGDDDQTIYAWRLADVRRILDFGLLYPDARRIQLATNYRCPAAVVEASAALIARNQERFAKAIRASPHAATRAHAISAVRTDDPTWPDALARHASTEADARRATCFLARTRTELEPVRLALVRQSVPHRTSVTPLIELDAARRLLDELRRAQPPGHPFHAIDRLRSGLGWRRGEPGADALSGDELDAVEALLGWATGFATVAAFLSAADAARARLQALTTPDALVELTTVHGAKGREWETVVLVGWELDRFPNRRALLGARDPDRALEEERRLGYVALTRATRRLILCVDPARPSPFLRDMGYRAG